MVCVFTTRSSNERESAVGLANVSKQSARRIAELTVNKFVGFRLLQVTYKLFEHSDMFGQRVMHTTSAFTNGESNVITNCNGHVYASTDS